MRLTGAVLVALLATGVDAQEAERDPFRLELYGWTGVAMGRPDPSVRAGGGIRTSGPLAVGEEKSFGRVAFQVDIDSVPNKTFNWLDVGTWGTVARVGGEWSKAVAHLTVGGQRLETAVYTGASFSTSLRNAPVGEDDPLRTFYRRYGIGVKLSEVRRGDHLWIAWGRDQTVGEFGRGQLQIGGRAKIAPWTWFRGRAALGLGGQRQSDYIILDLLVVVPSLL